MRLSAVAGTAAHAASRALLVAATPLQGVIAPNRNTHCFINRQARIILAADGHEDLARLVRPLADDMDRGSYWADAGWKSMTHMYNPPRGGGVGAAPAAPVVCYLYSPPAGRGGRHGAARRTAFFLGAAAHVVQDLCVPHHACNRLLSGHSAFEALAEGTCQQHRAEEAGLYDLSDTPGGWVHRNAESAQPFMEPAAGGPVQMLEAISELLPRAQRTTAGFIEFCLRQMGVAS